MSLDSEAAEEAQSLHRAELDNLDQTLVRHTEVCESMTSLETFIS